MSKTSFAADPLPASAARLSLLAYVYFAGDDRFGALGVSLQANAYVPATAAAMTTGPAGAVSGRSAFERAASAGDRMSDQAQMLQKTDQLTHL